MVTKKTGISRDLIIHPGEYIADILDDREISQSELATRTGVSEAYVSKVINGKKPISSKFAKALEYALGTPMSFWINLQANYEAELVEYEQSYTITEEEKETKKALKDVITYLRNKGIIPVVENANELILSLRKALQVSNLGTLKNLVSAGEFRISDKHTIDKYVLGAWLRICQIMGENQAVEGSFDKSKANRLIEELKPLMFQDAGKLNSEISKVMAKYGIRFSIVRNFKGAPVHGYIAKRKDDSYRMAVTIRGSYAGIFWFSLFHEIGHLVNDDLNKSTKFVDIHTMQDDEKEKRADEFAGEALLNSKSYDEFIRQGDYSIVAIHQHADLQKVPVFIVIERMQKDMVIGYNMYSNYKVRYKWA